ncbi:hypothetical protein ACLEJQ_21885 [Pseudomonas sp. SMV71]|uniref:hypothetical protein n=1 Tax=Pseudomonas sp. SMV71 TaxID=3390195 RepID=UPI003F8298EC
MALRGYPGIHAGMPTTQCLRSALVVNGALKIKSESKAKQSKAKQSKAKQSKAKRGGLTADLTFPAVPESCGSGLAREDGLTADQSFAVVTRSIVGASLLAMAA